MKRILKNKFVLWVMLPVLAVYAWYQLMFPTCTFRYKMTAEITTPDGPKSGSSVIEVSYSHNADYGGGHGNDLDAVGEAVFIPIDAKRLFVVTLTNVEANRSGEQSKGIRLAPQYITGALDVHGLPLKTFGVFWGGTHERRLCREVATVAALKRQFETSFESLPTLVVFEDVNNPDSVKLVQPDNLAGALGAGYRLENVWLELTKERPTNTGMKTFSWWERKLEDQKKMRSFGQGKPLIDNIFDRAFRRPGIWDDTQ